jgi:hypothetical protein
MQRADQEACADESEDLDENAKRQGLDIGCARPTSQTTSPDHDADTRIGERKVAQHETPDPLIRR